MPDLAKHTEMEDATQGGITQPGIERRNLLAFILGCCLLCFLGFIGLEASGVAASRIVSAIDMYQWQIRDSDTQPEDDTRKV